MNSYSVVCLSFVKTQAIVLGKLIDGSEIKLDQFASGGVMILNFFLILLMFHHCEKSAFLCKGVVGVDLRMQLHQSILRKVKLHPYIPT